MKENPISVRKRETLDKIMDLIGVTYREGSGLRELLEDELYKKMTYIGLDRLYVMIKTTISNYELKIERLEKKNGN